MKLSFSQPKTMSPSTDDSPPSIPVLSILCCDFKLPHRPDVYLFPRYQFLFSSSSSIQFPFITII